MRMKMLTASALLAVATAAPGLADGLEPGSVLVFPFHRTNFGGGQSFFTAVSVTNTNLNPASPFAGLGGTTGAHYEYVNITPNPNPVLENLPIACTVANKVVGLTPADTRVVLTNCDNAALNQEGYLVVSATDPTTTQTAWSHNYLVGSELAVSAQSGLWYLNAIPFRAIDGDGAATDHDLDTQLDFDGVEYEGIPDELIIDSYIADIEQHLILINLSGGTAFTANICFDIWNDNEQPLSATYSFRCWVEVALRDIGAAFDPVFLASNINNDPTELDLDCNLANGEEMNTGWAVIYGKNHSSTVESCPDAALLGAIGEVHQNGVRIGARRLWESREKQFDGDFLKTGTDDPECGQANTAPVCDAGGPYSGETGETINFDGTGSFDPDGGSVSFNWSFGDGGTGNGATPTHVYNSAGDFTVVLTVTDNEGRARVCQTTANIQSSNQAPICDAGGPYTAGFFGQPVNFDGSGSFDPDGGNLTFNWQFGDGSSAGGQNPTHTYADPGVYNVTLNITDDEGRGSSCGTTVTIDGVDPTCVIDPTPSAGQFGTVVLGFPNSVVDFDASMSFDGDGGSIVRYDWDFGDGGVALDAGPMVSHMFPPNSVSDVVLTITDDEGMTSTCVQRVLVD